MNPADILKYGHLTLTNAFKDIPESDWDTGGVCGIWSVKDILAHLASYEHMLYDVLAPFAGVRTDAPTLSRMKHVGSEVFNDLEVAERADKSVAQVVAEYNDTYARIMAELVPKIPPDKWRENGTLPWYGLEYSLDDYIVYTFYGHKREHGAQLDAFRDRQR